MALFTNLRLSGSFSVNGSLAAEGVTVAISGGGNETALIIAVLGTTTHPALSAADFAVS